MNQVILAVFSFLFLDILSYNLVNTTTNLIRSVSVASVGADRSVHSGAITTHPPEGIIVTYHELLAKNLINTLFKMDLSAAFGTLPVKET